VNDDRSASWLVQPLDAHHDRRRFDCGVEALNRYLQTQARQEMERDVSVVYVLSPAEAPAVIAGYYSLSSTAVRLADLPELARKRLPRYPLVPATLLGRLAVDQAYRGRRLGERLLVDALRRSLAASRTVASVAVIVDAKDDAGAAFYTRYGFRRFPDQPLRFFIPMKTIDALSAARGR
jgi:ribosomal protein S18 acetylase RimI-like enzyme